MVNVIKAIGSLPNTFWGILVLFSSMWIAVHYNANIGYYFAGVGSTLLGINHLTSTSTTVNNPPEAPTEVTENASN